MLFTFTIKENNHTLFEIPFVMDSKTEVIETINSIFSELKIDRINENNFIVKFTTDQELLFTRPIHSIEEIQDVKDMFIKAIENKINEYKLNSIKYEN